MPDPFFDDVPEAPRAGAEADAPPRLAGLPPYLAGLNDRQGEAVRKLDGPLLVLAGAGTGKTRVLTTRLAHLVSTGAARPWNVLAVTFTNKAAREMRERVAAVIGPMAEQVWLGTFHALGARILRRHAELAGLRADFTILDTDDQQRLLKQLLQAADIDDRKWPARSISGVIQRWKDRGLMPDRIGREEAGDIAGGRLAGIYAQYQERLKILNAVDFGDLLLLVVRLFQNHPDVLARYHEQFTHILVDEYQDTNVVQYLWLRLLAQKHRNICCVGDDDQSIYGWRGAEVGNILKFGKDFPGAETVRLEQNYRSTSRILAAASALIAHNEGRLGKTLWTDGEEGERIAVRGLWDGESEARHVGEEIEALQRRGARLSEIAVLVRAGFQTREFEERFLAIALPYRVVGGARFYERLEVRDALAYLRVIQQRDDDLAFERIVNRPRRGIGEATMQTLRHLARNEGISLYRAAVRIVETDELKPAAKRRLGDVIGNFDHWRSLVEIEAPGDLARIVLDGSGYTEMWQKDKSPEAPGRLENLKELCGAIGEFETLAGFLEHISLVMENAGNTDEEQVSIMTLHAAKGLEFDDVFLPGWEDGMFPNQRALDESGASGLEEERRLAYVGLTRARRRVHVCFAANRRVHGLWQSAVPSRFIDELPGAHVEISSEAGFQGSGGFGADFHDMDGYGSAQSGRGPGYGRRGGMSAGPESRGGRGDNARAPAAASSRSGAGDGGTGFAAGERVFHTKFGMGTISSIDGDKLVIAFDEAGSKKVVSGFVSKA